jgi:hypothetical protein
MTGGFEGVRIYAVVPGRDVRSYLEDRIRAGEAIDLEPSLDAYEKAISRTLQSVYPGARILVRRQDQDTPGPARTRVDTDTDGVDTGELEQEVVDLIAEFDVTSCLVYRDEWRGSSARKT